ncbi:sugar ABC transporter permease [Candidatus Aerophobetes bacterium]|nr:sugar ABC transporter permease [Candidatus Aerophobetes bacterium]
MDRTYTISQESFLSRIHRGIARKVPWYVWWLLPGLILLGVVTMPPFIWIIWMTFRKIFLSPTRPDIYVGVANYIQYFTDPEVYAAWGKMGKYVGGSIALQMGLGIGIAMLLNKSKHEDVLMAIYLVPLMFASVVTAYLYRVLLHSSYGLYHWLLVTFGIFSHRSPSLFGNPDTALWTMVMIDTWQWTPLVILIVLAGLKTVPRSIVEAARIDGAGKWRVFRDVIIPFTSPAILIALLLRFMDNVRFVDVILNTTMGGPADATKTISVYTYYLAFRQFDLGYGATVGFLLLLVVIFAALILTNVFRKYITAEG